MLFSATFSQNTKKVIDLMHNQKYSVRVEPKNTLPQNIRNYYYPLEKMEREEALINTLESINPFLTL